MAAKTPAERKREQRKWDRARREKLGGRVIQLEVYQGTAEALACCCRVLYGESSSLVNLCAALRKTAGF